MDKEAPPLEAAEVEIPQDEVVAEALIGLFRIFANRQSEVLRISEFVTERKIDIDDAKQRAKRIIGQQLSEVNETAIERLLHLFQSLEDDSANHHGDLPVPQRKDAIREAFEEIAEDLPEGAETTYIDSIVRSLSPSVGASFLHAPLLVMLVGELEMFANQLARIGFEFRPQALDPGDRKFSWAQVSSFESIDEFRDFLVDETIDRKFQGSLEDSITFLEQSFEIGPIAATQRKEAREAVQRRHCIVHNGGLASRKYLDSLSDLPLGIKEGDPLHVNGDYLSEAADSIFFIGYSLIWALGIKLTGNGNGRVALLEVLSNWTMYLIQEGRFDLVTRIAKHSPHAQLAKEGELETFSLIIKVNGWLAHKKLGNFEQVREEVEAFPVHAKSTNYKMAKAALLGDIPTAQSYAEMLLESDDLKISHIMTWPLLREVRDAFRSKNS